jgi:hypothetical protein
MSSPLDLADLSERLPYPLGLKLQAVRAGARARHDGEAAADLAFTIAAFGGLALRLCALVSLHAYVRAGSSDNELNLFLVDKLRTPADGTWREVTTRLRERVAADVHAARVHRWFDAPAEVPERGAGWDMPALSVSPRFRALFEEAPTDPSERKTWERARKNLKPAPRCPSVERALDELVTLRNRLVHGESPSEEALDQALLRVEAIARGAATALEGVSLQVREGDRAWKVMGHVPQPLETLPEGLEDQVPTLVFADGSPPLPLAPLLRFRPGADNDVVAIDELYFVNAAALDRLQYVGFRQGAHADGKELGTYEAFKSFWQRIPVTPSPRNPALSYDELAAYHAQSFVGRGEVLEEIAESLVSGEADGRYVELRALAGMGKSALLAMLYARQLPAMSGGTDAETRRIPGAPALEPLPGAWAFHFCAQTEGREYALVALRSVVAQLCDRVGLDRSRWLSNDLKELKEQLLPSLLSEVARRAGSVVVVLDALDESNGSDEEALAGCLPEVLPPGVNVVISWRVDAQNRASRVDRQLARIGTGSRVRLRTADPLGGLAREHVVTCLHRLAASLGEGDGAPVVADEVLDAVWSAATTDTEAADPFFLRFVSDGARDGRVDLERAESVPSSLEDAFEGQWLALPTSNGFLAQRMLLLLAILREYGDDELLAEFISRDPDYGATVSAQDIALVRQGLGKLLVYDGERYGLFHDRFKRFLVGEQKDPIAEALGEL